MIGAVPEEQHWGTGSSQAAVAQIQQNLIPLTQILLWTLRAVCQECPRLPPAAASVTPKAEKPKIEGAWKKRPQKCQFHSNTFFFDVHTLMFFQHSNKKKWVFCLWFFLFCWLGFLVFFLKHFNHQPRTAPSHPSLSVSHLQEIQNIPGKPG